MRTSNTLKQLEMESTRVVIAILVLQKKRTVFQSICNGTQLVLDTTKKSRSRNNGVQTKEVYNCRRNVGWIVTNWRQRFYGHASFSISTWKLAVAVMAINHLNEPTKCTGSRGSAHGTLITTTASLDVFVLLIFFVEEFPKKFHAQLFMSFIIQKYQNEIHFQVVENVDKKNDVRYILESISTNRNKRW